MLKSSLKMILVQVKHPESKIITSTEASVAVDMVEGAECKRERGHRSFAGDETFPFFWKVKVL